MSLPTCPGGCREVGHRGKPRFPDAAARPSSVQVQARGERRLGGGGGTRCAPSPAGHAEGLARRHHRPWTHRGTRVLSLHNHALPASEAPDGAPHRAAQVQPRATPASQRGSNATPRAAPGPDSSQNRAARRASQLASGRGRPAAGRSPGSQRRPLARPRGRGAAPGGGRSPGPADRAPPRPRRPHTSPERGRLLGSGAWRGCGRGRAPEVSPQRAAAEPGPASGARREGAGQARPAEGRGDPGPPAPRGAPPRLQARAGRFLPPGRAGRVSGFSPGPASPLPPPNSRPAAPAAAAGNFAPRPPAPHPLPLAPPPRAPSPPAGPRPRLRFVRPHPSSHRTSLPHSSVVRTGPPAPAPPSRFRPRGRPLPPAASRSDFEVPRGPRAPSSRRRARGPARGPRRGASPGRSPEPGSGGQGAAPPPSPARPHGTPAPASAPCSPPRSPSARAACGFYAAGLISGRKVEANSKPSLKTKEGARTGQVSGKRLRPSSPNSGKNMPRPERDRIPLKAIRFSNCINYSPVYRSGLWEPLSSLLLGPDAPSRTIISCLAPAKHPACLQGQMG